MNMAITVFRPTAIDGLGTIRVLPLIIAIQISVGE